MKILGILGFFILSLKLCFGQVEILKNKRFTDVKQLNVKEYHRCCFTRNVSVTYYFNQKDQVIRSEHFFKKRKTAEVRYSYDSQGNLTREIQSLAANPSDTIVKRNLNYTYNSQNHIIKIYSSGQNSAELIEEFFDHTELGKPQKVLAYNPDKSRVSRVKIEYNNQGQITSYKDSTNIFFGDTILSYQTEYRNTYNKQGDLECYSRSLSEGGIETPVTTYDHVKVVYAYKYDKENNWRKQFLIVPDRTGISRLWKPRRTLYAKRRYKYNRMPVN